MVGAGISGAELENLHALGVRGVRFNLVSPDGNSLEGFDEIARTIAPLDRCLPPELRQKALQNNPWRLYL